ncbi:hypothetical protein [Micromonospora sp. IBHARD004]|uniref:hypothetical protein n=1 Tax=Micromonospora sp. IBHARD004 TaxID=3457764 RepID=UPI0040589CCC
MARSVQPCGFRGIARTSCHARGTLPASADGCGHRRLNCGCQRVIDLGVDGIITDNPDLLVSVAIRNGLR